MITATINEVSAGRSKVDVLFEDGTNTRILRLHVRDLLNNSASISVLDMSEAELIDRLKNATVASDVVNSIGEVFDV